MSAFDVVCKIYDLGLYKSNLKYCLVNDKKLPYTYEEVLARPNILSDFVDFETLLRCKNLGSYAGVGVSIQASNICAIDVDHCFSIKNDVSSADERAKNILEIFKDKAYCEFSFSGTGLRIFFRHSTLENYADKYYIKNANNSIEFYQPSKSYRYVTITGNCIYDNETTNVDDSTLISFLDKYMLRQLKKKEKVVHIVSKKELKELLVDVKRLYFKNSTFQDLWFSRAPGSGKDESERDYQILALLYENITQDKEMIRQIFETSPYFKSKDSKHYNKWMASDYRYFEYMFSRIDWRNE